MFTPFHGAAPTQDSDGSPRHLKLRRGTGEPVVPSAILCDLCNETPLLQFLGGCFGHFDLGRAYVFDLDGRGTVYVHRVAVEINAALQG